MDQNNEFTTLPEEKKPDENSEQMEFMADGFKKNEPPPVENDPKRIALRRNIEQAFDALVPGMKISVTRLKPKWAAGWLDTFDVEFDEHDRPVIDLAEIKESYGGEKLMLRFLDSNGRYVWANTVDFRGIPPRDNGQDIENPRLKEQRQLMELEREKRQAEKQTNNDGLLKTVMEMQERNHQNMIASMQQQNKSGKPFGQIDELLTALDRLEGFRGNNGQQAPANNAGDISGMLTGLLSMLGNGQSNQTAPQQQRPAASSPGPRPQATRMPMAGTPQNVVPFHPQNPVPQSPSPVIKSEQPEQPEQVNEAVNEEENESTLQESQPEAVPPLQENEQPDIVDELAGMNDTDLAETVAELLGTIGEERTAAIFQHFEKLSKAQ